MGREQQHSGSMMQWHFNVPLFTISRARMSWGVGVCAAVSLMRTYETTFQTPCSMSAPSGASAWVCDRSLRGKSTQVSD